MRHSTSEEAGKSVTLICHDVLCEDEKKTMLILFGYFFFSEAFPIKLDKRDNRTGI